jgi:hypothetical protein
VPPGPVEEPGDTVSQDPATAQPQPLPPPTDEGQAAAAAGMGELQAPIEQPDPMAVLDDRIDRARPGYRRKRTGFLVGSGVALAASLGMFVGVIVNLDDLNRVCDSNAIEDFDRCDRMLNRVTVLEMGATTTGFVSMAFSGVGGSYWGKAAAADDWVARNEPRNHRAPLIAGATLVAVGGAATIGSTIGLFATCINDSGACNFNTVRYTLAAFATGTVVTSVGAAVLGYAMGYRRSAARWTRRAGRFSLGPTRGGMSVGYRARF